MYLVSIVSRRRFVSFRSKQPNIAGCQGFDLLLADCVTFLSATRPTSSCLWRHSETLVSKIFHISSDNVGLAARRSGFGLIRETRHRKDSAQWTDCGLVA